MAEMHSLTYLTISLAGLNPIKKLADHQRILQMTAIALDLQLKYLTILANKKSPVTQNFKYKQNMLQLH